MPGAPPGRPLRVHRLGKAGGDGRLRHTAGRDPNARQHARAAARRPAVFSLQRLGGEHALARRCRIHECPLEEKFADLEAVHGRRAGRGDANGDGSHRRPVEASNAGGAARHSRHDAQRLRPVPEKRRGGIADAGDSRRGDEAGSAEGDIPMSYKRLAVYAAGLYIASLCQVFGVRAQSFRPTRPVEIVVHSALGGGSDVFARAVVEMMEKEKLVDQPLRVVNKTAGASIEAMQYLVQKKGDEHTIAVFTNTWVATPLTSKEAKYSVKDLTPRSEEHTSELQSRFGIS